MRSRDPSRRARAIAGEAPRLVADSRFGPGENSVRVVERPTIPPAIYWRALCLRRRADAVERSVADWIAVIAEKLADLLSRETPLSGLFNLFHASPSYVAGNFRTGVENLNRPPGSNRWADFDFSQLLCPLCRLRLRPLRARVSALMALSREC